MANAKKRQQTHQSRAPIIDKEFITKMLAKSNYKKPSDVHLPKWEIVLSFAFWILNSIYAWYLVYKASAKYKTEVDSYRSYNYFVPGWNIAGFNTMKKDEANYEWRVFKTSLQYLVPCFIIHTVVYRIFERIFANKPEVLKLSMFITWIFLHVCVHGWFSVTVTAVHGLLMLISARFFHSTYIIWFTACSLLSTLALEWYGIFEYDNPAMYNLAVFIAYKLLQYISFCWYDIHSSLQSPFGHSLYDMFVYSFYLPYSSVLIVPYKEYCRQENVRREKTTVDLLYVFFLSLRVTFWTLFNDFLLHFFFMNSMIIDERYLNTVDPATLSSIGYVAGQFFHTKYMSIFGINTIFAYLDGMEPPWPPICISRVAFYSQMWRYFDRGLYSFLRDLIFVPIAYPSFTFQRRIFATFVCFAFVWLWHGMSLAFFCWVSMNFIEVMLENITSELLRRPDVDEFVTKRISPLNRRRLKSCGSIVCVAWGILAIFFFLGDYGSGKVFVRRLFMDDFLSFHFFYLIVLGYFYGNCCTEIELWYRERAEKCLNNDNKKVD